MFDRELKNDMHMANIIKGNITNADEVLKSEKEVQFEESIRKGEIEVVSMEDIKDTYNNTFYKGEDVAKVEASVEALIKKGEDNFLEEEEFESLEKAISELNILERKAVSIQKGDGKSYREIYVMPIQSVEEED